MLYRYIESVFRATYSLVTLAALLAPAAAAPRPRPAKYALLIGVQHYAAASRIQAPVVPALVQRFGPSRYAGPAWENLQGSLNDVASMAALLEGKFGFPPRHVFILPEAQATHAGILAAMRRDLVQLPHPGDIAVFYYAGHGSRQYNSLSLRPWHLEPTLVPVNANRDPRDVRNQEIARIFNAAVNKKILLTAIFDSCNSGSIARGIPVGTPGRVRALAYNPIDAHSPPDRLPNGQLVPPAEDRPNGALVLTASQYDQSASEWDAPGGRAHGAFTAALLQTLRLLPPTASAQEVFDRVSVVLDAMALPVPQQPSLAGVAARRRQPLFGGSPAAPAAPTLAVRGFASAARNTVLLDGGLYLSVAPGSVLQRIGSSGLQVQLEVVRALGVNQVEARILPPAGPRDVAIGDLFRVSRLVFPSAELLPVWIPRSPPPAASTAAVAAAVAALAAQARVRRVADPLFTSPDLTLAWCSGAWRLSRDSRQLARWPSPPSAAALAAALPPPSLSTAPRLYFDAPPSPAIARALRGIPALRPAAAPAQAMYVLAGRWRHGAAELAWARPNVGASGASAATALCSQTSSFPPRTDWQPAADADAVVPALRHQAEDLAAMKLWLDFPQAGEDGSDFPYRLQLYDLRTGAAAGAVLPARDQFGLRLQADGPVPPDIQPLWVYVLGIGCDGGRALLYPVGAQGNRLPALGPGEIQYPQTVVLTGPDSPVPFQPPYGLDTLVLLATRHPLVDLEMFTSAAVLSRGAPLGADPLDQLEHPTHGRRLLPNDYRIQYVRVRTGGS